MKLNFGHYTLIAIIIMVLAMTGLVIKSIQAADTVMVEDNYYEKELQLNNLIKARTEADKMGRDIRIELSEDACYLVMPVLLSENLDSGTVQFYNPVSDIHDKYFSLQANSEGNYRMATSELTPGKYTVKVSFSTMGTEFYKEETLYIKN
jgi:nitrogen fixation protein FixH